MSPFRTLVSAAAALSVPASAAVCDGHGADSCFLLASGHKMPSIAMGTSGGSYTDCPDWHATTCGKQHARFAVESWLQQGGQHVDGANNYRTQTAIAEAFRGTPRFQREDVFVTTKCPGPIGFEGIMQCADDNLQMLGQFTDQGPGYIDLLLIHFPVTTKPVCRFNWNSPECKEAAEPASKEALQESWRAMEALKRFGVVRSIGVSDYNLTNLEDTLAVATEPIDVHQVMWNPRQHDEAMLAFCKKHNIQLEAWSPLGGPGASALGEPVVKRIAAAHNVSVAQVVLKWSLQRGVAVVVGTANPSHAADDLASLKLTLTEEEVEAISALSSPPAVDARLVVA